jgi:membrane protease YdiL (CAAX protease family)
MTVAAISLGGPQSMTAAETQRLAVAVSLVVAIVVAGIALTATSLWQPVARQLGARVEPGDAAHAQGSLGLLMMTGMAVVPLIALGGKAPLVELLNELEAAGTNIALGPDQLLAQVYNLVWAALFVLWAAGWPLWRRFKAALSRLGVEPLRKGDLLPLVGVTLGVVVMSVAIDSLEKLVFDWLGWPMTDASIVTRLVPQAKAPAGALLVAACAGISEELIFRGLLQPRYGWLLANLSFTAAHALQYGLDGLVAVFALGAAQALVRWHWSTTGSIGVHFGYDALLLLASAFGF